MIDRMLYFSDGTVFFVFADAFLRPAAGRGGRTSPGGPATDGSRHAATPRSKCAVRGVAVVPGAAFEIMNSIQLF